MASCRGFSPFAPLVAIVLALGATIPAAAAAPVIVTLRPVADTTLIETAPTNNLGAQRFFNAGSTGLNPPTRNRGLLRFDIAKEIPAGSRIVSARLVLEVTGQPTDGGVPSLFELHRLWVPWGEGASGAVIASRGLGEGAGTNEATWTHRFSFTTNTWAAPGALAGADYATNISGSQFVYGVADSPYEFSSTPDLVADLQLWLDAPAMNHGWLLKSDAEDVAYTARRFGSREDDNNAAQLTVEFEPALPLSGVAREGPQFRFQFEAGAAGRYTVQWRMSLAPADPWIMLTNVLAATNGLVEIRDTIQGLQRFYRVTAP